MADYVSRQYLLAEYDRQHQGPPGGARKIIKEAPSEDVAPVIHGKWMKEDRGHVEYCAVCDQCGFDWMWSDRRYFKFCPNCGAKMEMDTR